VCSLASCAALNCSVLQSRSSRKVGDELLNLRMEPPEYFQRAEGVSNLNGGDGDSDVGNEGIVHSLKAITVPVNADEDHGGGRISGAAGVVQGIDRF